MHPFDVIPAPTKAHVTEPHIAKQLNNPNFPSLIIFNKNPPTAHNGAMTQNIIICVYLEAPHQ